MRPEYVDYNNQEISYERKCDPRELNVVERIKREAELKASLPTVNDDHVDVNTLKMYISTLEEEISTLKGITLVNEFKESIIAGGNILLKDNMDIGTAIVIDKDVTIDLNGKKLTLPEDTDGSGVFHVTSGTLTIEGPGCIDGVGKNDYNIAIWADGGNVVINGGIFTNVGATATNDPSHFDLIYSKNGSTVEINGGFFRCATPKWTLNKHDSTPSEIIVRGGTFVEYDPSNSETENPVANFVVEGCEVISEVRENGEIWYTVLSE